MPARKKSLACLPLVLLPLIGGCGGGTGYPSLARRPAELLGSEGQALPRCPQPTEACPGGAAAPRVSGSAPVVAPAPAPVIAEPSPGGPVPQRVAALVAEAQSVHDGFPARRAAAQAAAGAAAGAAPGSDGWARATTLLSQMQSAHGALLSAQAGIDRLQVEDRLAHAADDPAAPPRPDDQAIRDGSATVSAWADEEAAAIDAIRATLRQ
ncbi:MAG: hypothetical protein KGM17_03985 [Sphingomonadales bacterium]|nr:hypothetical protein [Sphingomonadales bacterium]